MLTLLNISNIALIDDLRVEFEPGLNLLTGETGSGKSIIVDALGVLIGGRFGSELLKSGAERAFIEGLFLVNANSELRSILERTGIALGDLDASASECGVKEKDPTTVSGRAAQETAAINEIIIRRELSLSGRNKIFINNQLATQSVLRELRPFLV